MGFFLKKKKDTVFGDFSTCLFSDRKANSAESFFPPEWYPQSGVQIAWPHKGSDWDYILPEVEQTYLQIAYQIAKIEPLLIVAQETAPVLRLLKERLPASVLEKVHIFACDTDDTWSRDNAVLSTIKGLESELLDFRFNGWGGKFPYTKDNAINNRLIQNKILYGTHVQCDDFVLEGGSIESDGNGSIMTTERCLLAKNRNPLLNKEQIEKKLKDSFHAHQVLWLKHGWLYGDDTDGHIDTLARFCPGNIIAYTSCDDPEDPHYEELKKMEEELASFVPHDGPPYTLIPLPLPDAVYQDTRTGRISSEIFCDDAERLPATYANFLILNHAVLYPTYTQEKKDMLAGKVLSSIFRDYTIVGIDCRTLIKQHGSLHCATMQFPKGVLHFP